MSDCACKTKDQFGRLPGESMGDKMAREAGERVGARLDQKTARALTRYCANNGCNTSEGIRRALLTLARETGDPASVLDAVARALGLDPAATTPEEMAAKIQALAAEMAPQPEAVTAEPAAVVPPAILAASRDVQQRFSALQAQRASERAAGTRALSRRFDAGAQPRARTYAQRNPGKK